VCAFVAFALNASGAPARLASEAIERCKRAVLINKDHPDALNVLGVGLAKSGRLEEAVPNLEKAIALTDAKDPMSLDMLAAMYSEVGRLSDAVATPQKTLDRAIASGNQSAIETFWVRLGRYQALKQAAPGS